MHFNIVLFSLGISCYFPEDAGTNILLEPGSKMRLLDLWNCCSLHIMLSDVFGAELCSAALVHMVGADLILVFLNLILHAVKCTLFCILCLHFYSKLPPV